MTRRFQQGRAGETKRRLGARLQQRGQRRERENCDEVAHFEPLFRSSYRTNTIRLRRTELIDLCSRVASRIDHLRIYVYVCMHLGEDQDHREYASVLEWRGVRTAERCNLTSLSPRFSFLFVFLSCSPVSSRDSREEQRGEGERERGKRPTNRSHIV